MSANVDGPDDVFEDLQIIVRIEWRLFQIHALQIRQQLVHELRGRRAHVKHTRHAVFRLWKA